MLKIQHSAQMMNRQAQARNWAIIKSIFVQPTAVNVSSLLRGNFVMTFNTRTTTCYGRTRDLGRNNKVS